MKIAVYKNDSTRTPYLVHDLKKKKGLISLGLEDYPDTEQDFYNDVNDVELLEKNSEEYKKSKVEIDSKL